MGALHAKITHWFDDRKASIKIMRRLLPVNIVTWITPRNRTIRDTGNSISGHYTNE